MAMLVENGYKPPPDPPNMHPFFRPAQRRPDTTPAIAQSIDYSSTDESLPHNAAATSSNAIVQGLDGTLEPESEYNHNESRRKRRKVTPVDAESSQAVTEQPQGSWIQQLEDAAGEGSGQVTVAAVPEQPGPPNEAEQITAPSPTPPVIEPSSRPQTPVDPDTSPNLAAQELPLETREAPPRMLKLAGGKLEKALKRSTKTDVAQKASPRRSTRQTRNLIMKRGRIVQSLEINIPYRNLTEDPEALGAKIEAIFSKPPRPALQPQPPLAVPRPKPTNEPPANPPKALHPFFSGKPAKESHAASIPTIEANIEPKSDQTQAPKAATAWKDIVFSGSKANSSKEVGTLAAPWPPLDLQLVQPSNETVPHLPLIETATKHSKQKEDAGNIPVTESVLTPYTERLNDRSEAIHTVRAPRQLHLPGEQLVQDLYNRMDRHSRLADLRDQICNGKSAFDRGITAGPLDWTHQYAPKKSEDVLQEDSLVLKNWLAKLKVHNVQSKVAERQQKKRLPRKKRAKRRPNDLDDFLVSSDEEDADGTLPVKNAILICGPHGVGKTASVFTAARELDYEVFEIHSGMRRTAKDIYDKVGDMTHNHLVQATASAPRSRASSVLSDTGHQSDEAPAIDSKQKSLAGFFGSKAAKAPAAILQPEKEVLQKQSLILFEEVDVVFDEDKTFWSGIQSLIATSKRPIVLTCNSLKDIDLKELSLHTILHYTRPSVAAAVAQLAHVAAAEGHIIGNDALRTLYLSRGQDLRAALADLSFWCQMTVGSSMGGLDWMRGGRQAAEPDVKDCRIVSKDTFYDGLHLVPEQQLSPEQMLAFAQDSLGVDIMEWEATRTPPIIFDVRAKGRLALLEEADMVAAFQSCMDFTGPGLQPSMSSALSNAASSRKADVTRSHITDFLLRRNKSSPLARRAVVEALNPITEDMRTFPPPTGRTASSLDNGGVSVATEVAPYVRHIVWLEQQLEKQRAEIDGSSQGTGRQRKTRAARAALEGGNVANTRVDPWFPKNLDFSAVLATGGDWHNQQYQWMPLVDTTPGLSRESTDMTMVDME